MARGDPQLNIRIPQSIKDDIEQAAEMNDRTPTGEAVARLRNPASLGIKYETLYAQNRHLRLQLETLLSVTTIALSATTDDFKQSLAGKALEALVQKITITD